MNQIKLNYDELTSVMHASNAQALDAFKKHASKFLSPNAPYEAVLEMFINWKFDSMCKASDKDASTYLKDVHNTIENSKAIINN